MQKAVYQKQLFVFIILNYCAKYFFCLYYTYDFIDF
jgi:hypothetical protein